MKLHTSGTLMNVIERLHYLSLDEACILQATLAAIISLEKRKDDKQS